MMKKLKIWNKVVLFLTLKNRKKQPIMSFACMLNDLPTQVMLKPGSVLLLLLFIK